MGSGRMREAVLVSFGARDHDGQARIQLCADVGGEAGDSSAREWRPLAEVRPLPPTPPEGWLYRLRPYDLIEAHCDGGWAEVAYERVVLPATDADVLVFEVRLLGEPETMLLGEGALRPLWALSPAEEGGEGQWEGGKWTMLSRRTGPTCWSQLTLRRNGVQWALDQQVMTPGAMPALLDEEREPTPLEMAAATAAEDSQLCTVVLRQDEGKWYFGGDGQMGDFSPPLAPMPPQAADITFAKGDRVEVGPTDEGYVGSWFDAEVIELEGGEPGTVCVRYETLEESEGVPLVEWQPRGFLRPTPPDLVDGAFPPDGFAIGDLLQLWYNDGWWECMIVPEPKLTKRQVRELRKKQTEWEEMCTAARLLGNPEPEPPLGLQASGSDKVCVKFVHYPEVHPNIEPSALRPSWVWRGGEWFWRVAGGVMRPLSYTKDNLLKPSPRKDFVPSGVHLALSYCPSEGGWALELDGVGGEDEARAAVSYTASVTLVPIGASDAGAGFTVHSGHVQRCLQYEEDEPSPRANFAVGQSVEVVQDEEGFEGAYYTADVLEVGADVEDALVRYHAFDAAEGSTEKLTDRVALRRVRPLPPKVSAEFLPSLLPGQPVEMRHEDGWWHATLLTAGDASYMPPETAARDFAIGTKQTGLDGKEWEVTSGSSASASTAAAQIWSPAGVSGWRPAQPGQKGVLYALRSSCGGQLHTVAAADVRPCMLWRFQTRGWEETRSLRAVAIFAKVLMAEEKQRKYDQHGVERRRELAEARRQAKLEELEAKREAREEEAEARARQKALEEEQRVRKKEEDAAAKKRRREEQPVKPNGVDAKWATAAAKKGITLEMAVEVPLFGGEWGEPPRPEFNGSWYLATVKNFTQGTAHVLFSVIEGFPEAAGELDQKLCAVPLERVRPAAPGAPDAFGKTPLTVGSKLELLLDGGFWEVELMAARGGAWATAAASSSTDEAPMDTDDAVLTIRLLRDGKGSKSAAQPTREVPLSQLRPGWHWKGGKWVGQWVPVVKSKRREEKEAQYARVQRSWPRGARVEVEQLDDGMLGSWYDALVEGHEFPDKVVVRYFEQEETPVNEDEREKLVQPEHVKCLRPVPPSYSADAREAWLASLVPGSAAELRYDDGWWEVEVITATQSDGAATFTVKSLTYDVEHNDVRAGEALPTPLITPHHFPLVTRYPLPGIGGTAAHQRSNSVSRLCPCHYRSQTCFGLHSLTRCRRRGGC